MMHHKKPKFYYLRYSLALQFVKLAIFIIPYPYCNILRQHMLNFCKNVKQMNIGDMI